MGKKLVWVLVLISLAIVLQGCASGSSTSGGGDPYGIIGDIGSIGGFCGCEGYPLCSIGYEPKYNYGVDGRCSGCFCTTILSNAQQCQLSGGISCDSGQCISPDVPQPYLSCTVSTPQIIILNSDVQSSFVLDELIITSTGKLTFIGSGTNSGGGSPGAPGQSTSPDNSGGSGGAKTRKGETGKGEHPTCGRCDCHCGVQGMKYGGAGGSAGGNIVITALSKFENNGEINLNGSNGAVGETGEFACGDEDSAGTATGGGGGGGGGNLIINSVYSSGNGKINLIGGDGGLGGKAGARHRDSSACDPTCAWSRGPFAGGGAGGNGGDLTLNVMVDSSSFITLLYGGIGAGTGRICTGDWSQYNVVATSGVQGKLAKIKPSDLKEHKLFDYDIPGACNNGVDDDGDYLIDSRDPDCYNVATDSYPGVCPSINHGPSGNGYGGVMTNGYTSTGINSIWQTSINGSDACCGDDGLADYGYISYYSSGIRQWLCYNRDVPVTSTTTKHQWLNAMDSRYSFKIVSLDNTPLIYSMNNSLITIALSLLSLGYASDPALSLTHKTDVISNSENWYYCNANLKSDLSGIPIFEGSTFPEKLYDGKYSCAQLYTAAFTGQYTFEDSCMKNGAYLTDAQIKSGGTTTTAPYQNNCCPKVLDSQGKVVVQSSYSIKNCECYMENSASYATPPVNSGSSTGSIPSGSTSSEVDKDACVADPESCLSGLKADPDLNCKSQPTSFSPNNEICNTATHFCSGGTFAITKDSTTNTKCCFGLEAECIAKNTITQAADCKAPYGELFIPDSNYKCSTNDYSLIGEDARLACCFGKVELDISLSLKPGISNTSFLCFKEGDNNIISQCCYDTSCTNKNYMGSELIRDSDKRLSSRGSSIHTINNFDKIKKDSNSGTQTIKDYAWRYVLNEKGRPGEIRIQLKNQETLGFSYLEFDILTDSYDTKLAINGIPIGYVNDYSTNGVSSRVWHHISIPLKDLEISNLVELKIYTDIPIEYYFIIDNIAVVPITTEDFEINTPAYYCSGGFEGWVSDLDPPTTYSNFKDYGPYMFACQGIGSYGWTGTKCCGDDTKVKNSDGTDNYGEHYGDIIAGCFDGSRIPNNKTISFAKGIYESSNMLNDQLQYFEYANLLYSDGVFIGCQLPNGQSYLTKSLNGNPSSIPLVTQNFIEQCGVIGEYYCMNGIWRQKVTTNYGEDMIFDGDIDLKIAPSGTELIKYGFRN